jgi:hypothetical protein
MGKLGTIVVYMIITFQGGLHLIYDIGFGLDLLTPNAFTTRKYREQRTISDLHTLKFTVTHALWFSAFTSRMLDRDS